MNKKKEPIVIMILRILLGCLFIFSGLSKAIDQIANGYQFDDYFHSFHLDFLQIFSLFMAYALTIVEFTLGVMMLLRVKIKFTSVFYLLFMCFFLLLTAWLALAEYLEIHHGYDFGIVKDCGCFGKVVKLSNLGTFLKNVGIIIPTFIVFIWRNEIPDIRMTELGKWCTVGLAVVLCFFLQLYCQLHLPVFDFSDWKVGENVARDFIDQPEVTETVYVYADSAGQKYRFSEEEMMAKYDSEPEFFDDKKDLDPEVKVISQIKRAPIQGFTMWTEPDTAGQFSDMAPDLIDTTNAKPLFIVFMTYVEDANPQAFRSDDFKALAAYCQQKGYDLVGLTNSAFEDIHTFVEENNITFPIYRSDCDPVKGPFIVRDAIHANPGIIYIQNGIVKGKWAWRNFDDCLDAMKKL